jgi:hypothetical protein
MQTFTESNITLDFPDTNYFRFADCSGYKALSGHSFKEMDACWCDKINNIYWLIELKDYSLATLTTSESIDKKSWDIAKKAYDSLSMFLAVRHGYTYAANLIPCFPVIPDGETEIKIITIIHCDDAQKSDVQLLHNAFRQKFKPYADLFGIKNYGVIEHSKAITVIPNGIIK